MPGILKMESNASDGPAAPKDGENRKRDFEGKLVNGERQEGGAVNGLPMKPLSSSPSAVEAASAMTARSSASKLSELPPEIVHISEENYFSLATMLTRVSQDTFNELGERLQHMSTYEPPQPQTNGAMPNGTGQHANGQASIDAKNKQKKLLLMDFAQTHRAKFIKLLVLTDWGKKAANDVGKLIDIYQWANEQRMHMDFVDVQLERIKIFSNSAAEKNPDIMTALEILSNGQAPWMPTLGYIPPQPISSEKALKLLRFMNTSLAIRLNVHEDLPRRLRNWKISSGRATFVIPGEMEFDVVSFVSDTSEQWFLVDLRLLFSPAPAVTIGSQFFMRLKVQADFILKEKGLAGLYDFLNNFALTHKITVLRSQAAGLARAGWSGFLKVEPVHRELVVQYWTGRPGKKNWIEIGISVNKPKNGKVSWRGPPTPSLSVRWFRQGKIVKNADLEFDWKDLSFEKVIMRVISLHTADILRSTQHHFDSRTRHKATLSEAQPVDCRLQVTLGPDTNTTQLFLEPVTGKYILQPATATTAKAEFAFNQGREPQQIAFVLTQVLAQTLRENVQRFAQQLGWQPVTRQALQMDTVKMAVTLDVIQYALFAPRGWSSGWCLAVVIDNSGISWWIFELGGNGSNIRYADRIKLEERVDGTALPMDRSTLKRLERVAVQWLSARITTRQLEKEKKQFSLRGELGQPKTATISQQLVTGWALWLQSTDLLATSSGQQPWLGPEIAITCHGLKPDGQGIFYIAKGKMMKNAAADMHKLMAASPQSGFKLSETGHFAISLSASFGHDILGDLRGKLRDVNRLRSFATTLQKRKMVLGSSSLQRIQFQYGAALKAAVAFGSGKEVIIEISHNNPHHRVLKLLTEIANERTPSFSSAFLGDTSGLDRFCTALVTTRSVVTALKGLESQAANLNLRNPAIHVHSILKYRITYENPVCTFDVRIQSKDDKLFWSIEDNIKQHSLELRPSQERSPGHRRLDNLQAKLKQLFSDRAPRWFGTRHGIVAQLDGVSDALKKLNEVVLSCTMEGGYKAPPPLEPVVQQNQSQAQHAAQQHSQPHGQPPQTNGIQHQPPNAQQQARMQQQAQMNQARKQPQPMQQGQRAQMNGRLTQQQFAQMTPQQQAAYKRVQQQQQQAQNQQNKQNKQDIIEID